MIRDLPKRSSSHISSLEEANRLMIRSLGKNPKKGGSPPSENSAMKDRVLVFLLGMELICLKWKIWLVLSKKTTDEDTTE